MKRLHRTIWMLAILALAIILVGCSTPTVVVSPTQDIPAIRTESVQTAVAKITIEAALNPSPTAAPTQAPAAAEPTAAPSATPLPSATAAQAQAAAPTATAVPTLAPTTRPVYPTATAAGPDRGEFVSQTPGDGAVFSGNKDFDGVWTIRNTGTATWNDHYYIRFEKGTNFAKADRYYLKGTVKPGETVSITADMVSPGTPGIYVGYWDLVNDNGAAFSRFYMAIQVK